MTSLERAGYLELSGISLYTVLHGAPNPVASVLLVGPFAGERAASYIPLVHWARFLAERHIEVLRYDYRGMGESTGTFDQTTFSDWIDDVQFLAAWLKRRSPTIPLVLHGLEIGALLASKVFVTGIAEALLAWAPPQAANEALRSTLLRQVALENMFQYGQQRKPLAQYIHHLESESLQVEGYLWSSRLWRDSSEMRLPFGEAVDAVPTDPRPIRLVKLDKDSAPLVRGSAYEAMNPDLTELFVENFEWLDQTLKSVREMSPNVH